MSACHRSEQASAYLDGELSEKERGDFEAHLTSCRSCAEEVEALQRLRILVSKKAPVKAPPFFYTRLTARLNRREKREKMWQGLAAVSARLLVGVVSITLALLAIFYWTRSEQPVTLQDYLLGTLNSERAFLTEKTEITRGDVLTLAVSIESIQ